MQGACIRILEGAKDRREIYEVLLNEDARPFVKAALPDSTLAWDLSQD